MEIPDSISLGVEVEFLTAQYKEKDAQVLDQDHRWACDPPSEDPYTVPSPAGPHYWAEMASVMQGCEALATAHLPTGCPYPSKSDPLNPIAHDAPADSILELPDFSRIRVWNKEAALSKDGIVSRADYWFMVREAHISVDVRKLPEKSPSTKYNWHGTELNSPVLTRPEEFKYGLPSLKRSLDAIQNNVKVSLNESCGLHLHVNQSGKLRQDTAKRIACLVLLLEEPLLYQISHPHRGKSPFCVRISTDSKAVMDESWIPELVGDGAMQMEALDKVMKSFEDSNKVDKKILQAMKRIYAQAGLESIRSILKKFDEGPVRTTRRCGLVVSRNDTLEFRYPASTFDSEYIAAWGQLVRHIFALAMKPADEFSQILCRVYELVAQDKAAGWEAAMEAIEFTDVGPEKWKKWISEFDGPLKDLDQQGIMPPRPRMALD
ncbi:hypothetical protein BKA56DRAFT_503239 [Ilyonectria sp. MPI-CAGE-AT-0026]|nr:hypothetical protein BKA56DRAFT_503239 [Ilyonectria sp. MPI-CAGE-AT-0026]